MAVNIGMLKFNDVGMLKFNAKIKDETQSSLKEYPVTFQYEGSPDRRITEYPYNFLKH